MMILRERTTEQGLLVSLCDSDVLGERFEDGDVSITVTEEFYDGERVSAEDAVESLSRASVANIVGSRAVDTAVEAGIIDEESVIEIGTTRHAQLLRLY